MNEIIPKGRVNITKDILPQVLEEVRDLYFVKKIGRQEIAFKIGKNVGTVNRLIKKIKQGAEERGKGLTEEISNTSVFLDSMIANYHNRIKKLWKIFDDSTNNDTGIAVLREIRNQEKHYITYLQDLGVVTKKQDKPRAGNINYISLTGKTKVSTDGKKTIIEQGEEKTNEKIVIDGSIGNA